MSDLDVEGVAIDLMMSIGCPRRLWDGVSDEIRDCYRAEARRLLAGIEQVTA